MEPDQGAEGQQANQPVGSRKTWLLVGLIVLLAVLVPVGLYFIVSVPFSNGTTGTNLSAPDTGSAATNALAPPTQSAANPARAENARSMDLLVVDQSSKTPLDAMAVRVNTRNQNDLRTDATGHARINVPPNSNYFNIRVSGKDYISKVLGWNRFNARMGSDEIPSSYTLTMERGTTVSGRIVDEAGRPVAGANILVQFDKSYADPHERADVMNRGNENLKSNDDGKWSFAGAPANCTRVFLTAWDTRYILPDEQMMEEYPDPQKLYDGTATYVMHSGIVLNGTVTGPDGTPAAGATIEIGNNRSGNYHRYPPPRTDAAGKFSLHFEPGQQVTLTIQSTDFSPELKQLTMGASDQSIDIPLSKAHRIFGHVVDSSGKPVDGASFYLQSWRGMQTISANFRADSTGSFHWNHAPADTVTFDVQGRNSREMTVDLTPDKDNTVTLGGAHHVRATVTDAQTGKPIDDFSMTLGIVFGGAGQQVMNQEINWQPGWQQDFGKRPGGFDFTYEWGYPGIAVEVRARGYLPLKTRVIRADEGNVNLTLQLQPGKDITAVVHAADGTPVSGALAVMATPEMGAYLQNSSAVMSQGVVQTTSGADGGIDFPPQAGDFKIALFADAGYAQVDNEALEKSKDIKLAPYGRIEGLMKIGSKPAGGKTVDLQVVRPPMMTERQMNEQQMFIQDQLEAKTDEDGKFVIEKIPPGSWQICRREPMGAQMWSEAQLANVDISSGQTVQITVGGTGRPVVGKVNLPPSLTARADWTYGFSQITTQNDSIYGAPPMPLLVQILPEAAQRQWMKNWITTDAGKQYMAKRQAAMSQIHSFPLRVQGDNTFRVEDVPAGNYQINLNLRSQDFQGGGQPIGVGSAQFTVPEMPGGRSDEPLQIDPIDVVALAKYRVGDPIMDMTMGSSDGKQFKFSDYRGKYLLLNFYPMGDQSLEAAKKVYQEYSGDNRIAFLTVTRGMFGGPATPPALPGVPWRQGYMQGGGMYSNQALFTNFELQKSQNQWLIGPDGKVAAEDLTGDAVEAAVKTALGSPQIQAAAPTQPSTAP